MGWASGPSSKTSIEGKRFFSAQPGFVIVLSRLVMWSTSCSHPKGLNEMISHLMWFRL